MNTIIERKHQVVGNLVCIYNLQVKYVDDSDPWYDQRTTRLEARVQAGWFSADT